MTNKFEQVPPGTRVFIAGNGPSLAYTPLELMEGEHSWGVNQVHLIYPRTTWRPTRLTLAEMTAGSPSWFPKIHTAIRANAGAIIYARDDAWWWEDWCGGYVKHRYNTCTHHDILDEGPEENRYDKAPDLWHFPQVCKFGGSVPMTIQLAVMHGYAEIYLIGCDLGHKAGTSNHFDPDYHPVGRGITAAKAIKRNEANRMGHEYALRSSPIPIYNATIGGELEVYPRVDYATLFRSR